MGHGAEVAARRGSNGAGTGLRWTLVPLNGFSFVATRADINGIDRFHTGAREQLAFPASLFTLNVTPLQVSVACVRACVCGRACALESGSPKQIGN